MKQSHRRACAQAVCALGWLSGLGVLSAQRRGGAEVIWQDRGQIAALDLVAGAGGAARAPGTVFTFVKESADATSPKFEVEDEHGTTWKVKLGEEARAETAATRLLWAAGYTVDADYYRSVIHVTGLPRLNRGREFVSAGGMVAGARLERESSGATTDDSDTWSWYDNPFVGTREFNGLRVMMALVNNWDLKAVNNRSAGTIRGGADYGVTDLGATLGRTGNVFGRSKGVPKDYADAPFIEQVTATHVDFVLHSRPFFLSLVKFRTYRDRTRMESVVKHIPIADARWIGDRLGALSAQQIADCFRAAGFTPAEVTAYTAVVQRRIAALSSLRPTVSEAAAVPADAVPAALPTLPPAAAGADCPASTCRQAPHRETLTSLGLGSSHVRAVVGGFEQGAGIGGGLELTSGGLVPAVELRATALTSSQLYRRFDVGAVFSRIAGSRNHVDVWYSDVRRDVDFFGVGSGTSADVNAPFAFVRRSYQGAVLRDLATHLRGGVYAQVMHARAVSVQRPAVPPTDADIFARSRVLSYGGFVAFDTRDNSDGLTRGVNLYGRVASAGDLGRQDAPAGYGWVEGEFDARGHVPIGSPRTALLLRSRGLFKAPKAGGRAIPFYELPWLGGRQFLRGYDAYRFRGNNVLLFQTELQRTVRVLTRVRGIDALATADAGQAWGDGSAFSSRSWRSGLGGGLQYRHSRRLAARVEISRSEEGTHVYFSMTRGF